jgi:hypothetical protein
MPQGFRECDKVRFEPDPEPKDYHNRTVVMSDIPIEVDIGLLLSRIINREVQYRVIPMATQEMFFKGPNGTRYKYGNTAAYIVFDEYMDAKDFYVWHKDHDIISVVLVHTPTNPKMANYPGFGT